MAIILQTQFILGFYDAPNLNPSSKYAADSVTNNYHTLLARKSGLQSIVVFKNTPVPGQKKIILTLDKNNCVAIMIAGPNAASVDVLTGN